jgi:hypothetical protein
MNDNLPPLIARNYYLPFMSAAGVLLGFYVVANPEAARFPIPPFLFLLVISASFEIFLKVIGKARRIVPLTGAMRFAGIFSGAILYFLVTFVSGGAPVVT